MTTHDYLINFAKKAEGPVGQTLFNHVSTLIQESTNDKNKLKGINDIELLSNHIKNTHFTYVQPPLDTELKNQKPQQGVFIDYFNKVTEIISNSQKSSFQHAFLPNQMADFQALKLAGISIGQFNHNLIHSIMKGMVTKNIVQLKFWGKILGFKDYFVIQGVTKNKVKDDISPSSQPQGQGVNYYSYWVTTDILSDWIELPLIKPEHIQGATKIKYIFTGDLDKPIDKYPTFNGKQKHLLKAQIVRITHNCQIVPKDLYKVNDDQETLKNEPIQYEQQFKLKDIAQLILPQNWVHLNEFVNSQGRCTFYTPPNLSQKELEILEQLKDKQTIERLRSIADDNPLQTLGMTTAWTGQQIGQIQQVSPLQESGIVKSYSIALLKNLNWPGSYTVGHSKGWVNIYIGYGHKLLQASFTPVSPKDLIKEGIDQQEYPQPYPLQPPPPPIVQNQQQAPLEQQEPVEQGAEQQGEQN